HTSGRFRGFASSRAAAAIFLWAVLSRSNAAPCLSWPGKQEPTRLPGYTCRLSCSFESRRRAALLDPTINSTRTPIISRDRIQPVAVSFVKQVDIGLTKCPVLLDIKPVAPPASTAAFSLTCIGPCGPAGSARHMAALVPWLDSRLRQRRQLDRAL